MGTVLTVVRRSLWLVLIGAIGGAGYSWWRDRESNPGPAEWPPLSNTPDAAGQASSLAPSPKSNPSGGDAASTPTPIVAPLTSAASNSTGARSSIVNTPVDTPEPDAASSNGRWVDPLDDGSCPLTHPVKANDNSGIFHVPDGRFYNRTKAERCYVSGEAAVGDGYRQAKN